MRLPRLVSFLIAAAMLGTSCPAPAKSPIIGDTVSIVAASPALTPIQMMDSTVQIHVDIAATLINEVEDADSGTSRVDEEPIKDGWVGSGVVYQKSDGTTGPVKSLILSANHVLDTPKLGSIEEMKINFMGVEMSLGKKRIDAVLVTLTTADGRTCSVTPLKLGSSDQHDVATAVADCDAGRVARIATTVPVKGEKVFVCGYPLGVQLPMLTEGYVSGWLDGYLLTSAPAYGGNSGGPVFYDGEVVGLLVRGSREYPIVTLTVSLEEILRRMADTPSLQ